MSMITMLTTLNPQREKIFPGNFISRKLFQGNSLKEFCQKISLKAECFAEIFPRKSISFRGKTLTNNKKVNNI